MISGLLLIGLLVLFVITMLLCALLERPRFAALRETMASPSHRWLVVPLLLSPALTVWLNPIRFLTHPILQNLVVVFGIGSAFGFLFTSALAAIWIVLPTDPNERIRLDFALGLSICCCVGSGAMTLFAGCSR